MVMFRVVTDLHLLMECGVSTAYGGPVPSDVRTERSPAKAGLHVCFSEKGEVKERREKFLTAKYGSHQMSLIRKRLAVEMWLYDELQKLYETPLLPTVSIYYLILVTLKQLSLHIGEAVFVEQIEKYHFILLEHLVK